VLIPEDGTSCEGSVGIEIPKRLVTNPGTEFTNRQVEELLTEFEIQRHTTTPEHARSHGAIERVHGTLTEPLRVREGNNGAGGNNASSAGL
jgi:transposase InsO family protein